jgi:cobalamin biosynthesis protein CobD/CbiB
MQVSHDEYLRAKRVQRVAGALVFITVYILPVVVLFILKRMIPEYAVGLSILAWILLIISLAPLGAFDTLEECSEIMKKYKNGY